MNKFFKCKVNEKGLIMQLIGLVFFAFLLIFILDKKKNFFGVCPLYWTKLACLVKLSIILDTPLLLPKHSPIIPHCYMLFKKIYEED